MMGGNVNMYILLLLSFLALGQAARFQVGPTPKHWEQFDGTHKRSTLAEQPLTITIGLKQRNLDVLEARLWEVSDPKHLDYGRWMSFGEVIDLVAPPASETAKVVAWLKENGVNDVEILESKDFLKAKMTVEDAERTFKTSYTTFVNRKTKQVGLSMQEGYTIPDQIAPKIDYVSNFHVISGLKETVNIPYVSRNSVRQKVRATSSAPILISLNAMSQTVSLDVIMQCSDGNQATISNSGTLTCSSGTISTFQIDVYNNVTGNKLETVSLPAANLTTLCGTCSQSATCTALETVSGISSSAAVCSPLLENLPNYLPIYFILTTHYSTSTTSTTTKTFTVQCSSYSIPSFLFEAYSIPNGTVVTQSSNNQSVVGLTGESFGLNDLTAYWQYFGVSNSQSNIYLANQNEWPGTAAGSGEASLDMEAITGIAQDCITVFWANAASTSMLTYFTDVVNTANAPIVNSVSYGLDETSDASTEISRMNSELLKAATRGLTFVVSAGDSGVFSSTESNGVSARVPTFPASSPYVTAVGATMFSSDNDASCYQDSGNTCNVQLTEIVASIAAGAIITSGSGFSTLFSRPSYQNSSVIAALTKVTGTGFSTNGRAYPDVSMIGHNVPVIHEQAFGVFDGTSASAPFFAAIITLLNDQRLANGLTPLGFVNPLLYSLDSSVYFDVVSGNTGCSEVACNTNLGFYAESGFDFASGLGTPNYPELAKAVAALGNYSATLTGASSSSSDASQNSIIAGFVVFILVLQLLL